MNFISFDIVFKKKNDIEVFKLSPESEFYQLKLMICGKYKIYDLNKLFIYYKGEIINTQDSTKLKEIFKNKKAKIEITDKIIKKKKKKNHLNIIVNVKMEQHMFVINVMNLFVNFVIIKKNILLIQIK